MFFGLVTGLALALGCYWVYNEMTRPARAINMLLNYELPPFMQHLWNRTLEDYYPKQITPFNLSLPSLPDIEDSLKPVTPSYLVPKLPGAPDKWAGIGAEGWPGLSGGFGTGEGPGMGGIPEMGGGPGIGGIPGMGGGLGVPRMGGGPAGPAGPTNPEIISRRLNQGFLSLPVLGPNSTSRVRTGMAHALSTTSPNRRPTPYENKNTTYNTNGTRYNNLDSLDSHFRPNHIPLTKARQPATSTSDQAKSKVGISRSLRVGATVSTPVNLLTRLKPLSLRTPATVTTEYILNYDYDRTV